MPERSLLLSLWRDPARAPTLTIAQWNLLLREIRAVALEARLSWLLEDAGVAAGCPPPVRAELAAQRYQPAFMQAQTRLEVRKVVKALATTGSPILLLKGAGYLFAGLPLARGRMFSDLDILVPLAQLAPVEAALVAAGWKGVKEDAYDQRYYRRWMHEIPPLYHPERGLVIDVHHAILPPTNRLRPDPALLWADSLALARPPLRVLSPADMVLHSAAHLFQDGEIQGGLNNLLDIHDLLTDFRQAPGFDEHLLARAGQLALGRPLYYALVFSQRLFGTQLPASLLAGSRAWAPNPVNRFAMDRLVPRVLTPRYPRRRPAAFAAWLLYLRSHWLRMPPRLLAAHLGRKLLRRAGRNPTGA